MCHFITAILSARTDIDRAEWVIRSQAFSFSVLGNRHLLCQLEEGAICFRPTKGMCDCGTALGSLCHREKDASGEEKRMNRQLRKLRRKGWSKTKIDRWLADKRKAREVKARIQNQYPVSAKSWVDFVHNTLDSGCTQAIGLLLHWYRGSLEDEKIDLKRTERVDYACVDDNLLLNIEEDVLYMFSKELW